MMGDVDAIKRFNNWLGRQPFDDRIVIAGNHDFGMAEKKRFLTNAVYLEDSSVVIRGLKFYGSPFTPQFGRWAYMLPRGQTILEKWLKIPSDTDVLITHGPPKGILDQAVPGPAAYPVTFLASPTEHLGCFDLSLVVAAIQPKLHVFGHIHGGYGQYQSLETGTLYINAAQVDESYQPISRPIVVDI